MLDAPKHHVQANGVRPTSLGRDKTREIFTATILPREKTVRSSCLSANPTFEDEGMVQHIELVTFYISEPNLWNSCFDGWLCSCSKDLKRRRGGDMRKGKMDKEE
ncbi:hypothetical protein SESBI_16006 [Sesbania bispinosa]|nr:hypothetical protein SESBI_16006 [Sesbania bispinosa]